MRRTDWLFTSGTVLFVAGAAIIMQSLGERAAAPLLVGLAGIVASVLCFALGAWAMHKRVDWRRVQAEQRLWESGILGRAWSRIRRTLLGR